MGSPTTTTLRRLASTLTLTALAASLGACSSDSSADDASTVESSAGEQSQTKLDKVSLALDFYPSFYYSGIYAAIENGYFEDEGIDIEILPYSFTPAETLIDSGQADLAISYPPDVVINRANGLEYSAVGALVNENTTALVVLDDSSYQRPADLDGKLYGGFGVVSDPPIVSAILSGDGVADPKFDQIVLSTDAVTALQAGEVDYTAVFGGVGDIVSEQQGIKLRSFPYRDFLGDAGNYPNSVFVASDETIDKRSDVLRRALAALAQGYEFAAENPDEANKILIKHNPTELAESETVLELSGKATAPVLLNEAGNWGVLEDSDFEGLAQILLDADVISEIPALDDLYTNSLLPTS